MTPTGRRPTKPNLQNTPAPTGKRGEEIRRAMTRGSQPYCPTCQTFIVKHRWRQHQRRWILHATKRLLRFLADDARTVDPEGMDWTTKQPTEVGTYWFQLLERESGLVPIWTKDIVRKDTPYPVDPEAVEKGWPQGAALNGEMLAKALYETETIGDQSAKFDELDKDEQWRLIQSANVVLRHIAGQSGDIEHVEPLPKGEGEFPTGVKHDPEATAQFAEAQEALMKVREYAHRVAEVFDIEGNQIKPDDPRLHEPDNRCSWCVTMMNEPQPMTPVRRQMHEKLLTGWHMPDCPTTLGRSWHKEDNGGN